MPPNNLRCLLKREYEDRNYLFRKIPREKFRVAEHFYHKDLLAHYGCVNAIEFSSNGQYMISGGDDKRILLWNIEEALHATKQPRVMRAEHSSNIFSLDFDNKTSKIFSAGNDDQVIVHDINTGDPLNYFLHEQPVFGLTVDPFNGNIFASAGDDGRILMYDMREPSSTEPTTIASYDAAFHSVMFNPMDSSLIATANTKEGVGLWDTRWPELELLQYGRPGVPRSCMSVRWDSSGTRLVSLRRRLPPVLYAIHSADHIAQFNHPGYYNSCTMKSCCFAGVNDEYILSGSDDFRLYMWRVPASSNSGLWIPYAHAVLEGHRSIANQVRYNPSRHIFASSGVEKLIKVWSPFPLPDTSGEIPSAPLTHCQRKIFTHEDYLKIVLRSGQHISHDYSQESTNEDTRMMAFFDSLVQREIEGWDSEEASIGSTVSPTTFSDSEDTSTMSETTSTDDETQRLPVKPITEAITRKHSQLLQLARPPPQNSSSSEELEDEPPTEKVNISTTTQTNGKKSKKKKRKHSPVVKSGDSEDRESKKHKLSIYEIQILEDKASNYSSSSEDECVFSNPTSLQTPSTSASSSDSQTVSANRLRQNGRFKNRNYRKRVIVSDSE